MFTSASSSAAGHGGGDGTSGSDASSPYASMMRDLPFLIGAAEPVDLSDVPAVYFREEFSISDPEVADVMAAGLSRSAQTVALEQRKLTQHLDHVEQELLRQISRRFDPLHAALRSVQALHGDVRRAVAQVHALRGAVNTARRAMTEDALEVAALVRRRRNLAQLYRHVQLISTVRRAQPTLQLLLSQNDFAGAMELIETTRGVLDAGLSRVAAFRHLGTQLTEMAVVVERMMGSEFERLTLGWRDAPPTAPGSAPANGTGRGLEPVLGPEEREQLEPLVAGLLRGGGHSRLREVLRGYRDRLLREVTAILRDVLTSILPATGNPDKNTLADRLRILDASEFLIVMQQVFHALLALIAHAAEVHALIRVVLDDDAAEEYAARGFGTAPADTGAGARDGAPALGDAPADGAARDDRGAAGLGAGLPFPGAAGLPGTGGIATTRERLRRSLLRDSLDTVAACAELACARCAKLIPVRPPSTRPEDVARLHTTTISFAEGCEAAILRAAMSGGGGGSGVGGVGGSGAGGGGVAVGAASGGVGAHHLGGGGGGGGGGGMISMHDSDEPSSLSSSSAFSGSSSLPTVNPAAATTSLRGALTAHAKQFADSLQAAQTRTLRLVLDNERWREVKVPIEFQQMIDAIVSGRVLGALLASDDGTGGQGQGQGQGGGPGSDAGTNAAFASATAAAAAGAAAAGAAAATNIDVGNDDASGPSAREELTGADAAAAAALRDRAGKQREELERQGVRADRAISDPAAELDALVEAIDLEQQQAQLQAQQKQEEEQPGDHQRDHEATAAAASDDDDGDAPGPSAASVAASTPSASATSAADTEAQRTGPAADGQTVPYLTIEGHSLRCVSSTLSIVKLVHAQLVAVRHLPVLAPQITAIAARVLGDANSVVCQLVVGAGALQGSVDFFFFFFFFFTTFFFFFLEITN
jgi:hypothetical protein